MVTEVEHARVGKVKTIGLPIKFSVTPGGVAMGAPLYGQHTREVLGQHGYGNEEIDALASAGAIALAEENA
jgi:crotonobetainyl-CoA:carnitine CoA-transferase CaiB-like acyl-CoA transferase